MLWIFLKLTYIFGQVSILIGMITSLLILIRFNKVPVEMQIFGIYFIISSCIDLIILTSAQANITNLAFVHLFTLIEFTFMVLFFRACSQWHASKINFSLLLWPGMALILINSLFVQGLDVFSSYSASLVAGIVVALSIRFLYHTMDMEEAIFLGILKKIVGFLLVYYAVSMVVIVFSNQLLTIPIEWHRMIWIIRGMTLMALRIMVGYVVIKYFIRSQTITR